MRRAPVSVLVALRDLAALGAVAFGLGTVVAALSVRRGLLAFAEQYNYDYDVQSFSWPLAVEMARGWTLVLLVWLLVVWCATRARAGRRTVWLPAALAALGALATSAVTLVLAPSQSWDFGWPWPDVPFRWPPSAPATLDPTHPAWAFPPLTVASIVAAAMLGARAGRRPDDALMHRVAPPGRQGTALVAAVVTPPALGSVAGAVAAFLARGDRRSTTAEAVAGTLHEMLLPLVLALLTAALLSGTGRFGALVVLLVAVPPVTSPVSDWLAARADGVAFAQAGAAAAAVTAAALWRPCAAWAARALAPVGAPPAPPPEPLEPVAPRPGARA